MPSFVCACCHQSLGLTQGDPPESLQCPTCGAWCIFIPMDIESGNIKAYIAEAVNEGRQRLGIDSGPFEHATTTHDAFIQVAVWAQEATVELPPPVEEQIAAEITEYLFQIAADMDNLRHLDAESVFGPSPTWSSLIDTYIIQKARIQIMIARGTVSTDEPVPEIPHVDRLPQRIYRVIDNKIIGVNILDADRAGYEESIRSAHDWLAEGSLSAPREVWFLFEWEVVTAITFDHLAGEVRILYPPDRYGSVPGESETSDGPYFQTG